MRPNNEKDFRALIATDTKLRDFWRDYLPQLRRQISDKYGFSITADELLSLSAVRINVLSQDPNAMNVTEAAKNSARLQEHLAQREMLSSLASPNAPAHNDMKQKIESMKPEDRLAWARKNGLESGTSTPEQISSEERARLLEELEIYKNNPGQRMRIARLLGMS